MDLVGENSDTVKSNKYGLIELYESIESIRGTVLLNYKWTPRQIDKLEFQDENYRGLFFIYNEIIKGIARTNSKK